MLEEISATAPPEAAAPQPARTPAVPRRRVVAVGPYHGMTTGQQQAFRLYVDHAHHDIDLVDAGLEGLTGARKAVRTPAVVAAVAARLLARRPDALYLTTSRSTLGCLKDLAIIQLASRLGVPVINHLHGNDFAPFRDGLQGPLRRALDAAYRRIDGSIVLARGMADQYAAFASTMRIAVVPNCSTLQPPPPPPQRVPQVGQLNALFLSNLVRSKGVVEFIEGVRLLRRRRPDLRLQARIHGATAERPDWVGAAELQRLIADEPAITYGGVADATTRVAALAWADAFVLPTWYPTEAAPMTVIEALTMGCVPVVALAGYIGEMVAGAVHLVVAPRQPGDVADRLERLADDAALRAQAAAANPALADERFSLPRYVAAVDGFIDAVIGTARTRGRARR